MSGNAAALLIRYGANINVISEEENRSTALHLAVKQFNEAAVLVLVQEGCEVNMQVCLIFE